MGCAQSRIENEEAVSRCKERRSFMREAVSARNAFAAAHSSYSVALKNTGAALSDFAQGETDHNHHHHSAAAAVAAGSSAAAAAASSSAPPIDKLPPPPPPLPDFSPPPLQRSASMPDLPKTYLRPAAYPDHESTIVEEEDGEEDEIEHHPEPFPASTTSSPAPPPPPPPPRSQPTPSPLPPPPPMPDSKGMDTWDYFFAMDEHMAAQPDEIAEDDKFKPPPEPPVADAAPSPPPVVADEPPVTPEKLVLEPQLPKVIKKQKNLGSAAAVHHQHTASTGALETKRGKMVVSAAAPGVGLLQVLNDLDDHFLKASESAHEVSVMLEANRMHYHSNFADNRGHIDHSARVLRVITWNRSFKGLPNGNDARDDFDNDEWETHATVLDKMLAWEKKLYEEVKAGELMKIEYQRKVALLNKQKKRGASPEAIEKTKAAVSHLHTRYIVDMQSLDSTVSEVQRLRDNQLYPKLTELVDAMARMWEAMYVHHDYQLKIVADLRGLDITGAPKETSEHHYERTIQLHDIVRDWQEQFQKLVSHQKEYIHALNSWLKLNVIPIESSLKEKVSSPPRPHQPPIQALLHAWCDYLEKVPDDLAKTAIASFAGVISTIKLLQEEELKQREKCAEIRKEYTRKVQAFEDWHHKYSQRKTPASEADPEGVDGSNPKDPVADRRLLVETLKARLDEEDDAHKKLCKQVREKSLGSLRTHLPELFRAMSDFAVSSSEMYKRLSMVSRPPS